MNETVQIKEMVRLTEQQVNALRGMVEALASQRYRALTPDKEFFTRKGAEKLGDLALVFLGQAKGLEATVQGILQRMPR